MSQRSLSTYSSDQPRRCASRFRATKFRCAGSRRSSRCGVRALISPSRSRTSPDVWTARVLAAPAVLSCAQLAPLAQLEHPRGGEKGASAARSECCFPRLRYFRCCRVQAHVGAGLPARSRRKEPVYSQFEMSDLSSRLRMSLGSLARTLSRSGAVGSGTPATVVSMLRAPPLHRTRTLIPALFT
jgi:hypothetical protein